MRPEPSQAPIIPKSNQECALRSLQDMTSHERAYMARHYPRTYRKMKNRPTDPFAKKQRRLAKLTGPWNAKHREVRTLRLLAVPKRLRRAKHYEWALNRIKLEVSKLVSWGKLRADDRQDSLVRIRHATIWLLLKYTHLNLPQIGMLLDRDHTTIIHARDRVNSEPKQFEDITGPIEACLVA